MKPIRILPDEIPVDSHHKMVCDGLMDGSLSPRMASGYFGHGGGLHPGLFILTMTWVQFRLNGSVSFALTKNIQEALALTEVDVSPLDMRGFPLHTTYIAFPDSELKVWCGGDDKWRPLGGAFLSFRTPKDDKDLGDLDMTFWGIGSGKTFNPEDDSTMSIRLDMNRAMKRKESVEEHINFSLDSALSNTQVSESGEILERPDDQVRFPPPGPVLEEIKRNVRMAIRSAINTLLFISSIEGDGFRVDPNTVKAEADRKQLSEVLSRRKSTKKLKKALNQYDKISPTRIVWVGHEEKPVKEPIRPGYWMPRREGLRHLYEAELKKKSACENLLKKHHGELSKSDSSDVVTCMSRIMDTERLLVESQIEVDRLAELFSERVRWVRPVSLETGAGPNNGNLLAGETTK